MTLAYGEVFKAIRISKNMSAKEVAILSNISNSYLSEFENLKKKLPVETLAVLFKSIGINFEEYTDSNKLIRNLIINVCRDLINYEFEKSKKDYNFLIDKSSIYPINQYIDEINVVKALLDYCLSEDSMSLKLFEASNIEIGILNELLKTYKTICTISDSYMDDIEPLESLEKEICDDGIKAIIRYHISICYEHQGNYIKALTQNKSANSLLVSEGNVNRLLINQAQRAGLLYATSNYNDAINLYTKLIETLQTRKLDKVISVCLNNLSWIYFMKKKYNEVFSLYENNKKNFLENSTSSFILIWSLYHLGRLELIESILDDAAPLDGVINIFIDLFLRIINIKSQGMIEKDLIYTYNNIDNNANYTIVLIKLMILYYENSHKYKRVSELKEKLIELIV